MVHFTSGSTELTREQLLTMHQNRFITVYQLDFQRPKQSFPECSSELQILPQSAEDTQIRDDENDTHTDSKVIGWRRNTSPCENPARLEQQIGSIKTRVPRTRSDLVGLIKESQSECNFLLTPQMTLQAISGCAKRPNSVAAQTEFARECQSQCLSNPHRKPEVDLVDEMVHFTSGSTELTREPTLDHATKSAALITVSSA
ncbi:hypothetical protein FGIG_06292 [Fasciola gigantica]|uniref:Uncharacterized protein n=1 Tax=Fasciola gigantica TaxID=46835 RepID=A0A504YFX9_FASGI|nr:hypothetical protein FGIG_06292 [Fasciola gigantica]